MKFIDGANDGWAQTVVEDLKRKRAAKAITTTVVTTAAKIASTAASTATSPVSPTTSKSSTSSLEHQKELSAEDYAMFKERYNQLNRDP